uniref:2-dehydropantoate 2-reductase n=1 Tax=Hanusia phi TaxID=3032 RepID=A0A7S0DWF2_9CRYP
MGMTFRHVQGRRAMHKLAIRELTSIENIAVIGGGSIGSLLSGRIAATSRMRDRVWMLTSSSEHASAIKAVRGIVVKEEGTVGKNTMMGQVRVAESLSEVEDLKKESLALYGFGKASLVFIAVKQAGLRKAAEQAARVLAGSHGSLCIAVMNGVGHMEVIHKALRYHDVSATLIQGIYSGGAYMLEPGVVAHAGRGKLDVCQYGSIDDVSSSLLEQAVQLLNDSGIPTQLCEDILQRTWRKVCVNASINALTTILGEKNGFLLESEESCELIRDVAKEGFQVACAVIEREKGAESQELKEFFEGGWETCANLALHVAHDTSKNTSSMLADMLRGRKTEIEAINGMIVSEGLKHGIATPVNQTLLRLIRCMENRKQTPPS